MERKQYDVFISYSRKDYQDEQKNVIPGNEVSKIKDALTEAGITYWFDEDGIYSGQNFAAEIINSIESAHVFIFLSTVNSNSSPWTCKEIASADEFKKPIIPVRIDKTPYNKKILFRIADLDYIDYYTSPEKGREELVSSVKAHLNHLEEERKRKEEEEKIRKELEQKKAEERQREQEKLINRITLDNTALNNDEEKLELERKNLLIKTERVLDKGKREELKNLIHQGGVIHKKYREELTAIVTHQLEEGKAHIEKANIELDKAKIELEKANIELELKNKTIARLQAELKTAKEQGQKELSRVVTVYDTKRPTKRIHFIYGGIIALLTAVGACLLYLSNKDARYMTDLYAKTVTESKLNKSLITSLSKHAPFIIKDIEIKDSGADWGDRIRSSKATYLYPRINYCGLKTGDFVLGINIYQADKKANQEGNFSYTDTISIQEGDHLSESISGWGSAEPGSWPSGTYIIEIWCGGEELAEKSFVIY